MYLKSLEIQGFKSFPDKTRLSFGKGITAVVGPNGSGKSNISDAIRWVMGEMSAKTLRGSRMEDVIFGGTVLRRAQGFAEVTLTIDNSGHELPLDGDELAVTRRYYRSGESEYLLNRKEVRLRDINELFMDTGLGRDGYSIIGQGRIAEIVSAKSEDRREIFEEAAGISKYRYRKEESERRLSAAEENLTRLRDILAELEARVGPLKEQAEKAKRYIEFASEKKTLEVGLWLYTLDKQRETLREHENRLNFARAQYKEIEEKMNKASLDIEEAYMAVQLAAAEAEKLRASAQRDEEEAAKNGASAAVIENDIIHNNENIARIRAEIDDINAIGEQDRDEVGSRQEKLLKREADYAVLCEQLAATEKEVQELAHANEHVFSSIDAATSTLSALNMQSSSIKFEKSAALSSSAHISERLTAISTDFGTRFERMGEAEKALEGCQQRLSLLGNNAEELSNSLKGYELKAGSRRERLRGIEERTHGLTLKEHEKTQRCAMLTELERQMEGFSHSVKLIMRECGRLAGIHGPVSRLIHVRGEYAVAVETALGASAQHIIVESEENAKTSIAFLKQSDGGRATFLPISSVHGSELREAGVERIEGFVGIASGLLDYDVKYDGIIKSLLGRTVVASDLDCAVNIAKKFSYRFRIVTLDGQLVNAGGSLTGGSTGKYTGLLSRAGEIEKLSTEVKELREALEKAELEKKAATAELSSLDASIAGIRGELVTAQEDIIRLEGEKKRLNEQSKTLSLDITALETEKTTCTQRISEFEVAATDADIRYAQTEDEITAVSVQLDKLGYNKEELSSRHDVQTDRFNNLRLSCVSSEKDIEADRLGITELERRLVDRGGRAGELLLQIELHEEKNTQARKNEEILNVQAVQLRLQVEESLKQAGETATARTEIERHSVELRAAERAFSEDKEKISRELARLEERKLAASTEYDSLISRLWEEYELTRSEAEKTAERITDSSTAQKRLNAIKKEIKEMGDVNVSAIEEYKEVFQRYTFLKAQIDDVEKSKAELLSLIDDLTGKMREIFSKQFEEINRNFSETFVELFGGGSAHLSLSEPEDVLRSGIDIVVQPPGKIIKNLTALSGGEQAFVAIALYFAILKVSPSPFCVLDEIEAALDDSNVSRFASYLRRMCTNTQFIIITHRRGTMDEADILYGVTMQDEGISKLLTLDVSQLIKKLGIKA